ncbi:MAG: hypothetical protein QOH14_147 [Pseudonocardiales bacterium]|jgi:hypothetical protein|nr:hypothetical protein [Pseudonocardiales bacterium]
MPTPFAPVPDMNDAYVGRHRTEVYVYGHQGEKFSGSARPDGNLSCLDAHVGRMHTLAETHMLVLL